MHEPFCEQTAALAAIESMGWVQRAEWLAEVESTNLHAYQILSEHSGTDRANVRLPALWIADRQTAGRGRSDHQWWSPDGCLMLTLALDPTSWARGKHELGQLALVVGVAATKVAERYVEHRGNVQLKWPNDLYVSGAKCGGILIESGPEGVWLVGIGINVTVDLATAPSDVRDRATSLDCYAAPGCGLRPDTLLVDLIGQLEESILDWARGSTAWLEDWHEHCMLAGRVVRARAPDGRETIGRCEGIDGEGLLLIRDELGVTRFGSGEIIHWQ